MVSVGYGESNAVVVHEDCNVGVLIGAHASRHDGSLEVVESERERERETHTHTHIQTHRHTDTQTHRHTNTNTQSETEQREKWHIVINLVVVLSILDDAMSIFLVLCDGQKCSPTPAP